MSEYNVSVKSGDRIPFKFVRYPMNFISENSLSWFPDFFINFRQASLINAKMRIAVRKFDNPYLFHCPLNILLRHRCFLYHILDSKLLVLM